jgi:hypothetical protein
MEKWLFLQVGVVKDKGFEGGILRDKSHLVIFSEKGFEKSLAPHLGLTVEYRT